MSDWPPKPFNQNTNPQNSTQPPSGQEWQLLEKVVMASVNEQRRARRWGIFFKALTFLYLFIVIFMMLRACNGSDNDGRMWKQVGFQDSRWRKELYNWYFPVCGAWIFG